MAGCDLEWENEKNGNVGHLVEKKALWQVSCDERTGRRDVGLVWRHKKGTKRHNVATIRPAGHNRGLRGREEKVAQI